MLLILQVSKLGLREQLAYSFCQGYQAIQRKQACSRSNKQIMKPNQAVVILWSELS